jgi:hypothetical protein
MRSMSLGSILAVTKLPSTNTASTNFLKVNPRR